MDVKDFKENIQAIKIPDALDSALQKGIKKGEKMIKRDRTIRRTVRIAAGFLLIFTSLVVSINLAPAFAAQIEQLPGGTGIVNLLRLSKETVDGGEITDGQDIESIKREEVGQQPEPRDVFEKITISLGDKESDAGVLAHYEVTYHHYPYSAVIYLSGVRGFSAMDDLANMKEGPLVHNAYRLITLDDSAHRFVITFKKPVTIEVTESDNPAALILTIRENKEEQLMESVYALRSKSFPFGEEVGVIEQMLAYEFGAENARMLQDKNGTYLIEEGNYKTQEDAQARLEALKALGAPFELLVEERKPADIPEFME